MTDLDVFIITDVKFLKEAFAMLNMLRENKIKAGMSFDGRSFKSQMREADSRQAGLAAVIGENEIKNKTVMLKDMSTGEQEEVAINRT